MEFNIREQDNTDYDTATTQPAFVWTRYATVLGHATRAGAWTLGPSSGAAAITHLFQNSTTSATPTVKIQNRDTTSSSDAIYALHIIKGSTTATTAQKYVRFMYNADGSNGGAIVNNGGDAAAFAAVSDRRLKTDIEDFPSVLSTLQQLRPVEFKWKKDGRPWKGFIAQELYQVLPQFVCKTDDGEGDAVENEEAAWQTVDTDGWVPYFVKAIQELKSELDSVKAELAALKGS
jgi:hypothetical protein